MNNTLHLFFEKNAISILLTSNNNSFRVLSDEKTYVYFLIEKIYLYISIRNGQPVELALYQLYMFTEKNGSNCICTLSFPIKTTNELKK